MYCVGGGHGRRAACEIARLCRHTQVGRSPLASTPYCTSPRRPAIEPLNACTAITNCGCTLSTLSRHPPPLIGHSPLTQRLFSVPVTPSEHFLPPRLSAATTQFSFPAPRLAAAPGRALGPKPTLPEAPDESFTLPGRRQDPCLAGL